MSCFFCRSKYHVSQYCDVVVTNESRKNIIETNKICNICYKKPSGKHARSRNCKASIKCYICYTKEHHTFFCPDRFSTSKLFLPNIDADLIKRFLQTLDAMEQLSLACSIPKVSTEIILKPIKIIKSNYYNYETSTFAIVISHDIRLYRKPEFKDYENQKYRNFFDLINSKFIFIKAKTVQLNYCYLTQQEMFQVMTPHTKFLELRDSKVIPKISFEEMLKQIPDIEQLDISETNIIMDNNWPTYLLKYKTGNNFKRLRMIINDPDFHVRNLYSFIETKCLSKFEADIFITNDSVNEQRTLQQNLQKIFIPLKSLHRPKLHIAFQSQRNMPFCSYGNYTINKMVA